MEGPIFELGVGQVVIAPTEVGADRFDTIGLCDEHGALICLGDVPTGINAPLTAVSPPEPGHARAEYRTEIFGAGIVTTYRIGGCVNFVGLQPALSKAASGLDCEVLERWRGLRVRLDMSLSVTACECTRLRGTESGSPEAGRP